MATKQIVDVASVIEHQRNGHFIIRIIALSWIITFFDGYDMNAIAFAAPYIEESFSIDRVELGQLFSIGLFGALIGSFLFGWIGDKYGRRPAIILSVALFGVGTILFGMAPNMDMLLLIRLINGITIGGLVPLIWALNIEFVPRRFRSTVVTVIMVGYSLGASIAGPIAVWLGPAFGWPSIFYFGGVASLISGALLWLFLPESARYLTQKGRDPARIARILEQLEHDHKFDPESQFILGDELEQKGEPFRFSALFQNELKWLTPLLWLAYIGSSMAIFFNGSWGPLVFEDLGYSRSVAAFASSAGSIIGAIGGLLLMRFTDRFGVFSILAMPLGAIPLLLLMGVFVLPYNTFIVINLMSSLFLGGQHFGMHSIAGIFYPSSARASGTGWASGIAKCGAVFAPLLGGLFLASGRPVREVFIWLALCPAVLAVALYGVGLLQRRIEARLARERDAEAVV